MLKIIAAGMTALFVTASPLAYAQAPMGADRISSDELAKLTDARIEIVKAGLQLSPDQMKYWPAIESAIRSRAQNREARIAKVVETVGARVNEGPGAILRDRDPVAFLNRRADALGQRSADLKKLADAWEPLYKTLTPDQKQRMAALTIFVLSDARNALRERMDDD